LVERVMALGSQTQSILLYDYTEPAITTVWRFVNYYEPVALHWWFEIKVGGFHEIQNGELQVNWM
jgi:hypothetical protein